MRHFEDRLTILFRRQQEKSRSSRKKKPLQQQQSAHDATEEEDFSSGVGNTAEGASTRMKSQDILRNKNRRCECARY